MNSDDFEIKTFLDDNGIRYDTSSGGQEFVLDSCPSCGKSNKFYISADSGKFICFHCVTRNPKMRGGPIGLVMLLGDLSFREAKKLVEGREVDLPMKDDEISSLLKLPLSSFEFHQHGKKQSSSRSDVPDPLKIPRYMLRIDKEKFPTAWNYLKNRGLSAETIDRMDVYVSGLTTPMDAAAIIGKSSSAIVKRKITNVIYQFFKSKKEIIEKNVEPFLLKEGLSKDLAKQVTEAILTIKYKNRVIFMVRIENLIFGWVARDFTKQSKLKVMNSSGPFKYFCVWNYDNVKVKDKKEIVVAEGIVSAAKCGIDRSVATLGKYVTNEQIQLLKKTNAETIYICLDVDAQQEAMELKQRLLASFKNVYNVSLPPIKAIKCKGCGEVHDIDLRSDNSELKCKCGLTISGSSLREEILEADYKDAGDYSPEEMDVFIREAKELDVDSFLLGDSVFDD